jgi:hypothetical protein
VGQGNNAAKADAGGGDSRIEGAAVYGAGFVQAGNVDHAETGVVGVFLLAHGHSPTKNAVTYGQIAWRVASPINE